MFKDELIEPKSLEERVAESCCSFHVGLDGVHDSTRPIKFIMSKNGVMKVVQNSIGLFIVGTKDVPGLPDLGEGVLLNIPKVPYPMLLQTITFFRAVMEKFNNTEAMVQFYYDRSTSSYIMHCPDQEVSGASIKFKRDQSMDDKYTLVMDIHSHNTMGAFFSNIDDADEKETRIFGVIGKLKNDDPEMKFRISVGGDFKEISVFDIFEYPFPEASFPKEWLDKCVKHVSYSTYSTYSRGKTRTPRRRAGFGSSAYTEDFYDEYYDLYYDTYDKVTTSGTGNTSNEIAGIDVFNMKQADLVDLVKDILITDIEAVALAVLDERMEDDMINYLHKYTINSLMRKNDL